MRSGSGSGTAVRRPGATTGVRHRSEPIDGYDDLGRGLGLRLDLGRVELVEVRRHRGTTGVAGWSVGFRRVSSATKPSLVAVFVDRRAAEALEDRPASGHDLRR